MADQEILHYLPANWKGEEITFTYNKYNGVDLIHIRVWYLDQESGEMRPSKIGIVVKKDQWPSFLEGVNAATIKLRDS